ncbi:Serine/threonine-protein kinase plk1 [Podochytrium sp. JEL0797]|nr:Serine/threonine-protein kinase plk1 [Podochytrium sp. JEL0797]
MERYWASSRVNGQPHVWTGKDQETGEDVIMKLQEIENDSNYDSVNERARMEAHTLAELTPLNPHRIVNFKAFYKNSENQYVLVMEKAVCSLQDVLNVHKKLSEHEAKVVIHGVLEGLVTCHKKLILQRDIKPANLLLFSNDLNSIKIGDFGNCAEDNGYSCVGGIKGTAGYMAPEILKKQQYGVKVDIWSLGILAFQILYGQLPFPPVTKKPGIFSKPKPLAFPSNFHISNEAPEFIKYLLVDDPDLRPTAAECLAHPWLKSVVSGEHLAARSAQFAPDPPIIPTPVPGFSGWLRLVRGNEPAYYFHEPTKTTQWNHPEEDPLPQYLPPATEVRIRNTSIASKDESFGAAAARRKTENGRRRSSASPIPPAPLRGFSNPELLNSYDFKSVGSSSASPAPHSRVHVVESIEEDEDEEEVPLVRKKGPRAKDHGVSLSPVPSLSPPHRKPHGKSVSFSTELSEMSSVSAVPAAPLTEVVDVAVDSLGTFTPPNSPVSPLSQFFPNPGPTPANTMRRVPSPPSVPPPPVTKSSSMPPPPSVPPPLARTYSAPSVPNAASAAQPPLISRTPAMFPSFRKLSVISRKSSSSSNAGSSTSSAPISDLTLRRVTLNRRVQELREDPHSRSRFVVNLVVWSLFPFLAPFLKVAAFVFLISQLL